MNLTDPMQAITFVIYLLIIGIVTFLFNRDFGDQNTDQLEECRVIYIGPRFCYCSGFDEVYEGWFLHYTDDTVEYVSKPRRAKND